MTSSQQSNLYWTGGSFHTRLGTQGNVPEDVLGDAVKFLDEYRGACQKQYIAFNRECNGRHLAYDRYKSASNPANMDNTIFIGTAFPNSPISKQSPGSSTIATMKIREFLEGLVEGGEFENQHAKAFLVFVFHLWEEKYRPAISRVLSVDVKQVKCDLMGDIRLVRNLIIHEDTVVPRGFVDKLALLQEIWTIQPGELKLTGKMIHSVMEQLNALRVDIAAPN